MDIDDAAINELDLSTQSIPGVQPRSIAERDREANRSPTALVHGLPTPGCSQRASSQLVQPISGTLVPSHASLLTDPCRWPSWDEIANRPRPFITIPSRTGAQAPPVTGQELQRILYHETHECIEKIAWRFFSLRYPRDLYEYQRTAIESGLRGRSFAVMAPTGAGKSLTFQLLALHDHGEREQMTIVIEPTKDLIE
jgi:hypothetical protein